MEQQPQMEKKSGKADKGAFGCVSILTHYEKFPANLNIGGGRKHFTLGDH